MRFCTCFDVRPSLTSKFILYERYALISLESKTRFQDFNRYVCVSRRLFAIYKKMLNTIIIHAKNDGGGQ